jgi:hypothetical protein
MLRTATLTVALLALVLPAAAAQWYIGATTGSQDFGAVADDTASGSRWVTLSASTALALRIERRLGRVSVAMDVAHSRAGFAVEDGEFALVAKDVFRLWEFAPELGVRAAGADTATSLWLRAGPILDVWLPDGADTRVRGGAFASASLLFPLLGRVTGELGLRGSVTPSPFNETELPPEFAGSAATRVTVLVGARYRL